MELGSHVWPFVPLGFWFGGISLLLFHLECDSWLVKFWFTLICWFGLSAQTYKLLELIWELLTLSFHTPPGNPLEKQNFFDWSVYSYDKKNSLKTLDLYWHRIEKWTEVPLCLGLPPEINSLGLIKLRPLLPQRDNPCWDQSALVIMGQVEHYMV